MATIDFGSQEEDLHKGRHPVRNPRSCGERHLDETRIRIISYNETELLEKEQVPISACEPFLKNPDVSWISVMGIHDADHIDSIGKCFRLHPLVMEDIMHSDRGGCGR
ncbi:conserved domain protein [delta proteobacterium NaphS2]|nr:conserved domain protein [delta proteobacterium NaphS2]